MERITGTFRSENQAERVLAALEEAGFSNDLLSTMLHQQVDIEELDGEGPAAVMVVINAEEGAQADKARTILNSAGALDIQTVDHDWEAEPAWSLGHIGRPSSA